MRLTVRWRRQHANDRNISLLYECVSVPGAKTRAAPYVFFYIMLFTTYRQNVVAVCREIVSKRAPFDCTKNRLDFPDETRIRRANGNERAHTTYTRVFRPTAVKRIKLKKKQNVRFKKTSTRAARSTDTTRIADAPPPSRAGSTHYCCVVVVVVGRFERENNTYKKRFFSNTAIIDLIIDTYIYFHSPQSSSLRQSLSCRPLAVRENA